MRVRQREGSRLERPPTRAPDMSPRLRPMRKDDGFYQSRYRKRQDRQRNGDMVKEHDRAPDCGINERAGQRGLVAFKPAEADFRRQALGAVSVIFQVTK